MSVSFDTLMRTMTTNEEGCWLTDLTNVAIPGGRRVRPAAFMWRHLRADEFHDGDHIINTCGHTQCCNPDHTNRISAHPGWTKWNARRKLDAGGYKSFEHAEATILMLFRINPADDERRGEWTKSLKELYRTWQVPIADEETCERRAWLLPEVLPTDDNECRAVLAEVGIIMS